VAVRPDLRGTGLGKLVTAAAIATGRGGGISRAFLFTETARGFFEAMGFTAVERGELPAAVAELAHAAEECPTATVMTLAF
jgi:N-acetylglutamate synthase-like GNAT family acetyltransferase